MIELGAPRYHFKTVTSTNDFAKEGIVKGVPNGSLYTANHQTKGRGRRGATWSDEAGASALMSFVFYPDVPLAVCWVLSFAASLAVCEALQALGAPARIKWPNDILIADKKVAGVLVEMANAPSGRLAAIVGIGVNVCQEGFVDSDLYATAPISLRIALGNSSPFVEQVVDDVSHCISQRYEEFTSASGQGKLLSAWRAHLMTGLVQEGIDIETGQPVQGILSGVRLLDGVARLETADGTFKMVRPREAPEHADQV